MAAQPARHEIGAPIGLGVQPESGDATEIDHALLLGGLLGAMELLAHDGRTKRTRRPGEAAFGIGKGRRIDEIGFAKRGIGHGTNRAEIDGAHIVAAIEVACQARKASLRFGMPRQRAKSLALPVGTTSRGVLV